MELSGGRWQGLQPDEEPPEEDRPGPWVAQREVFLTPGDEALGVRVRWRVRSLDPDRWVLLRLAGPEVAVDAVSWNGRPASATATEQGTVVVGQVRGEVVIELQGAVIGKLAEGGLSLHLEPATVGTVQMLGPDAARVGVGSLDGAVAWLGRGRVGTGVRSLRVERVPPRSQRRDSTIAIARAAVGLTVGDAEVRTHVRVRWEVARGELGDTATVTVRGAGPDLEVTGPLIASWTRTGDQIVAKLRRADARLVVLDATWSASTPQGEVARLVVPQVEPAQAFRTETAVQLARDGEVEMVPEASGLQVVPSSQLPDWADGLVQGTPTAAFLGTGRGEVGVDLLRFQPVEGPATLVDVASYTVAATEEGRVLIRAHFAVRNDRGAFLRVQPPAGLAMVGARVGGDTAEVASDGGAWLVPLQKSVETVEGLLSFPVEVVLLGELGGEWARREERAVPLPTLDAEVAVSRVTLHLPPGYRSLLDLGEQRTVASFTEGQGITYGFATGDVRAAEAELRFQEAVSAWMDNRFDEAQGYLDELGQLGADNDNISRLQSNLDVVMGSADGDDDGVALSRRVKDQAQARAQEDVAEQREILDKAKQKELKGDYAGAEADYRQALEVGEMLDQIAQDEDMRFKAGNSSIAEKLQDVSKKKAEVDQAEAERESRRLEAEAARAAEEQRRRAEAEEAARRTAVARSERRDVPIEDEEPRGQVLTEEFLERVPSGRSYQSAVQMAAGVTGEGELVDEEEEWEQGVPGGVEGGVVGGVLGGVAGGTSDEPLPPEPEPIRVDSTSAMAPRDRPNLFPKVKLGSKKAPPAYVAPKAEPAAPPPSPPPESISVSMGGDDKPLEVTAAALSVVVPELGDAVRYQRLLLPAGAPLEVTVRAKEPRRFP